MTVRNRGMNEDTGRFDVRHDSHEVNRLMRRSLVDLQRIGKSAMKIARIRDAADDRDCDFLERNYAVEAVNCTDKARGIAARQLQIILADALFIVRITMEENVRDGILFAALEDRLYADLLIKFLVLCADAARRRVQHNVNLTAQIFKRSLNRDIQRVKSGFVRSADQVQIVLDAVCADHVVLTQCADREGRSEICNTDQFHIALCGDAVSQTLTDCAVTGNTNSNLCHGFISPL